MTWAEAYLPKWNLVLSNRFVWPQYTNVTDRQRDNGPIAQGEPFYKQSTKNHLAQQVESDS